MFLHVLVADIAGEDDVSIQSSSDLQNWLPTTALEQAGVRQRADQLERLYRVPLALPEAPQIRFFRLRVQAPP